MTDIEKIETEIERRMKFHKERGRVEDNSIVDVLFGLLSFVESMEKESKGKTNPLFEECLTNVEPDVRKEVCKNIDKMLEKEQDVDLEKEIIRYKVPFSDDREYLNENTLDAIARHFYELGLNAKSNAPKIKGWVARDKSGDLYFFHYDCKPHRTDGIFYSECSEDVFHIDNSLFPEVDWQTKPIEVELTISELGKNEK